MFFVGRGLERPKRKENLTFSKKNLPTTNQKTVFLGNGLFFLFLFFVYKNMKNSDKNCLRIDMGWLATEKTVKNRISDQGKTSKKNNGTASKN